MNGLLFAMNFAMTFGGSLFKSPRRVKPHCGPDVLGARDGSGPNGPGGLGARVSLSLALATFSQGIKRRHEAKGAVRVSS